jgi:hypothetical protein
MACCGQRRALASASGRMVEVKPPSRAPSRVALYEYTGNTGMTVTGAVSGMKYRFEQPGSKVQIDSRDVSSLAGLPNLRRSR